MRISRIITDEMLEVLQRQYMEKHLSEERLLSPEEWEQNMAKWVLDVTRSMVKTALAGDDLCIEDSEHVGDRIMNDEGLEDLQRPDKEKHLSEEILTPEEWVRKVRA
jgi:hypothetical protein